MSMECLTRLRDTWKEKLNARYSTSTNIFSSTLNSEWMPECVIMDAMLLLDTKPLRSMKTFSDYANFLFDRYVIKWVWQRYT